MSLPPIASLLLGFLPPFAQNTEAPPTAQPAQLSPLQLQAEFHERLSALQYEVVPASGELPEKFREELRGARYGASSPTQRFSTGFLAEGIRVQPWGEDSDDPQAAGHEPSWTWGLELVAHGREGARIPASPPTLVAHGARVEYRRGELVEWYENTDQGLEQGFTLARRPEGDGLLRVEMAVVGTLSGVLSEDARSVRFHELDAEQSALHFEKLMAFDADGRFLDARFELCGDVLAIAVDDSTAQYPLTIDPLATTPSWTAKGGQFFAEFGTSVATAGDVNGDGYSDVIAGAPMYDNGFTQNIGRALVYHGSASGLSLTANWSYLGPAAQARLGYSVSTAGDVNGDGYSDVILGAPRYSNGQTDEGAAYLFLGSPTGLSATPHIVWESNQAAANFGWSVATLGDANGDGYSDVIVGAPLWDNGQTDEGGAWAYHGSPSGPSATANWSADGGQGSANFGWCVAAAGDVNGDGYGDAIVGAPLHDTVGLNNRGRASVFHGGAGGLGSAVWIRAGVTDNEQFGFAVSGAGDLNGDGYCDIAIGAPYYSAGGFGGLVWVYHGTSSGVAFAPEIDAGVAEPGAEWGFALAPAGDLNGDGYGDLLIGAPSLDDGTGSFGAAYVMFGSSVGLTYADFWTTSAATLQRHGRSVGAAGDVNGDGVSDLIIGAPGYNGGLSGEGGAFVHHGVRGTLSNSPGWSLAGVGTEQGFGAGVASAGDVNGDGYSDVIVASSGSPSVAGDGRVQVFHGSSNGLSTVANSTTWEVPLHLGLGPVSTAGDVNGDGFDDIVFGMPRLSSAETDEGGIFVAPGSPSGLGSGTIIDSDIASAQMGFAVSTAGDVNGDGYADIVVGAPYLANGHTYEGRVYVFHGSSAGLVTSPAWTFEPDVNHRTLGTSVSGGGDFNGDGYSDILVGAPDTLNPLSSGSTYVFYGSPSGITTTGMQVFNGSGLQDQCGGSVAYVGDMNGDGLADAAWTRKQAVILARGTSTGLVVEDLLTAATGVLNPVTFAGDVDGDGLSDVVYREVVAPFGIATYLLRGSSSTPGSLYGGSTVWAPSTSYVKLNCAGDVNGDGYSDVIAGTGAVNGVVVTGDAWLYYGNARPGVPMLPRQRQADDSAPIALRGWSDDPFSVRFAASPRTPYGRVGVKLEVELESEGDTFDGAGLVASPNFASLPAATAAISELRDTTGRRQHWRMRLRYDPASSPLQQFGRWVTLQGAGWNEGKFNPTNTAPVTYCTSGTSSSGCVPTLSASGAPSIAASSSFTITAAQLESQKLGLFYYGVNGRHLSAWGTSDSFLCVKAPTQRMGALNSGGGIAACDGTFGQDWLAYLATHPGALGTPFAPGQVVNVQGWYRDPASPKTTNLTGGLEFVVIP